MYTLLDEVPVDYLAAHLRRLLERVVADGGRLIAGDYGSRSRGVPARDIAVILEAAELAVAGSAGGGDAAARFAWVDRES